MTDRLQQLSDAGVSIWLDDLSRERLETGNLADLVEHSHVVGVTTNPSIFQAALSNGERYDAQIRELAAGRRRPRPGRPRHHHRRRPRRLPGAATGLRRHRRRRRPGLDRGLPRPGPRHRRHRRRGRPTSGRPSTSPTCCIKIPGTAEGCPAITETLAAGISVNVTLIFGLDQYHDVMEAHVAGLEKARDNGHDLSTIHSVASFFVSRVDTEIDKRLDATTSGPGTDPALKGKAGVANARLAFQAFEEFFAGDRWASLEADGARRQRPLWASTGVKNPDYDDTMYVVDLVVEDTVNTMPEKTLDAVADHGEIKGDQVRPFYDDAAAHMKALADAGIDYDDVIDGADQGGRRQVRDRLGRARRDRRRRSSSGQGSPVTEAPVDPTSTEAWSRLTALADGFAPDLRGWFADDPGRVDRLTFTAGRPPRRPLQVPARRRRARRPARPGRRGRAARRAATRCSPASTSTSPRTARSCTPRCACPPRPRLEVDGQDVVARRARRAATGSTPSPTRSAAAPGPASPASGSATVVNIGIGGSDLGPVMAYEALAPYRAGRRSSAGSSPTSTRPTPPPRWPASTRRRTLFIVSSKTFGTLETLTNARLCKAWLLDGLARRRDRRAPRRVGGGRTALRRRLDRARQGRGLRHRPGQRVRLLGLGGRPLLRGLRDRHLAGRGDRPGAVRRVPGRLPRDGRALPYAPSRRATCRC